MSLYLKYRPKTVEELDLTAVRASLNEIIRSNSVSHAYLLTGPRGAGKTSTARILARIVNCEKSSARLGEPCNSCRNCTSILNGSSMDFVEIDAASNRGIDDIRELKEKIRLAPGELTYKVYVIDEVHMLTTEAFNALLKTLEEPPAHALFILCTTETHKVPETIISRCVRIQFTKATVLEMKRSFARVVAGEGKKIQEEALEYLARSVDGSFRDGVKILDLVLSKEGEINLSVMEQAIMGASGYTPKKMIEALVARETVAALTIFRQDMERGVDLVYLLVSVMKGLRDRLLAGETKELTKLVYALDEVARKVATSPVPEVLVEMVIIEWGSTLSKNNESRNGGNSEEKKQEEVEKKIEVKKEEKEIVVEEKREMGGLNKRLESDHREIWRKLMAGLSGDSITMGALLSKATPAEISGDLLTIRVGYGFHRDQIMSEKVLSKLEKLVSDVVGVPMRVKCEVGSSPKVGDTRIVTENDTMEDAIAIFS